MAGHPLIGVEALHRARCQAYFQLFLHQLFLHQLVRHRVVVPITGTVCPA